jgi:hypothetical protein
MSPLDAKLSGNSDDKSRPACSTRSSGHISDELNIIFDDFRNSYRGDGETSGIGGFKSGGKKAFRGPLFPKKA